MTTNGTPQRTKYDLPDTDPAETAEWLESVDALVDVDGQARARYVLNEVLHHAQGRNVELPPLTQTDYINTIGPKDEAPFPGDEAMEKRIRQIVRWNAMALVQRANKRFEGIGGHISTYASSASLYEVGFNHFFRGPDHPGGGDQLFIQGHASPGIYARAFLEGRLSQEQLDGYRREVSAGGLPSYPHPWLMPTFWQFPTVSMGLGPLAAVYQARFNRYLQNRGLKDTSEQRVFAFLGDGETDEPEVAGCLSLAAREGLDNLVFVVNCNLQRLDGPVRGNGKIVQELESLFRGAGWHVIKVLWGPEWDELLARDHEGALVKIMNETVDGEYQRYTVEDGAYVRQHFFGKDPRTLKLVEHLPDARLIRLRRGGHSYRKLYAAYAAALAHRGSPVVILAKTVKGWTLGQGFEAAMATHQLKKLDEAQVRKFRDTLELDIPDSELANAPYYHPGAKSPEVEYLLARRAALGGSVPARRSPRPQVEAPARALYGEFVEGGKPGVEVSTTMAFVRLLRKLLRDPSLGKLVVPIVPDEGRTFGMESLFKEIGIYAAHGQKYEPADAKLLLSYSERQNGQLLQEGINEAGSMASFTAAGTAHATHGVPTIPFYIFYSMFGFQRTQDQIWAFGDARGRGFLLGATAGRTTLNGEGLQHEDGHSHLQALAMPNCQAYDPAYAYELAVIVREGLERMLNRNEDVYYYLTLYNENYAMPPMPAGAEEGIVRGIYKVAAAPKAKHRAQLWGSGPLLGVALEAQRVLAEQFDVGADVWSVTSYQQLYRDARATERWNRLHPGEPMRVPYVASALAKHHGPIVTTSDWVSELPSLLARFVPNRMWPLGTNGYGRSDTRDGLRRHFEVDVPQVVATTLYGLAVEGKLSMKAVRDALQTLGVNPEAVDPAVA